MLSVFKVYNNATYTISKHIQKNDISKTDISYRIVRETEYKKLYKL
jgi:hypothetical protein